MPNGAEILGILAGGAEGGFGTYRGILQERRQAGTKENIEAKKAAALEKRQKNLMRYGQMSGKYQEGRELTRGELEELAPEERTGLVTTEEMQRREAQAGLAKEERMHQRELEKIRERQRVRPQRESDIKQRELYNTAYQRRFTTLIDEGIDYEEADRTASTYAESVSGFSPTGERAVPASTLTSLLERVKQKTITDREPMAPIPKSEEALEFQRRQEEPEEIPIEERYKDYEFNIKGNYVWGKSPEGRTSRLFKVEKPTVRYGDRTYPNPKYEEYIERIRRLGIEQ